MTHRCTLHVTVADPGELAAVIEAVERLGHPVECPVFDEWSRLMARDQLLREAHGLMSRDTPWGRCVQLEAEIRRFECVLWPRWSGRTSPEACSRLRALLFRARRLGPLPASARQLWNIVIETQRRLRFQ